MFLLFGIYFTPFSSVPIVEFEQVNVGWMSSIIQTRQAFSYAYKGNRSLWVMAINFLHYVLYTSMLVHRVLIILTLKGH